LALHAPPRLHAASATPPASASCHFGRASRFQKKLDEPVTEIKQAHPHDCVEVWGQDEARLGLKPVWRRVWSPRGVRPVAITDPRYEWLWLYAAVHPQSGRVFWLVLPYLNAEMMQLFLDEFAQVHATFGKRIVVVLDGGSAHRAKALRVPKRLTLIGLPA